MSLVMKLANRAIRNAGFQLTPVDASSGELPDAAHEYLRPDNTALQELSAAYRHCDPAVTNGFQWRKRTVPARDLLYFRGDTAYVWQREAAASYVLTARYVSAIDADGLLDRLAEDGLFGARTVEVDDRMVSRDQLDSILEMYFLKRYGIRPDSVLDIGAGYGRLAHRMTTVNPQIRYQCTDAVPASTFLSRYYLSFRKSTAVVIPLNEFQACNTDLAVNIHSFTECTVPAVNWWLSRLEARYLMIVPNAMDHGGTKILNSKGEDLMPVIASHGFELLAKEPKYADRAVQAHGIQPTWYYLFVAR